MAPGRAGAQAPHHGGTHESLLLPHTLGLQLGLYLLPTPASGPRSLCSHPNTHAQHSFEKKAQRVNVSCELQGLHTVPLGTFHHFKYFFIHCLPFQQPCDVIWVKCHSFHFAGEKIKSPCVMVINAGCSNNQNTWLDTRKAYFLLMQKPVQMLGSVALLASSCHLVGHCL